MTKRNTSFLNFGNLSKSNNVGSNSSGNKENNSVGDLLKIGKGKGAADRPSNAPNSKELKREKEKEAQREREAQKEKDAAPKSGEKKERRQRRWSNKLFGGKGKTDGKPSSKDSEYMLRQGSVCEIIVSHSLFMV